MIVLYQHERMVPEIQSGVRTIGRLTVSVEQVNRILVSFWFGGLCDRLPPE